MKYGIVCTGSFGDCIFNTTLVRAVAAKYGPIPVATQAKYQDAYRNLPYVHSIWQTAEELTAIGCKTVVDTTPSNHFDTTRGSNYSLIDMHYYAWVKSCGELPRYDYRPDFNPTDSELAAAEAYSKQFGNTKLIAIESAAFSGQSWAKLDTWQPILERHSNDTVLWLSNQDAPNAPNVDNLLRFSRREVITLLGLCKEFYTTGSGFFCSSLANYFMANQRGPEHTTCLWIDDYYKYEDRFKQLRWDDKISWVHNQTELLKAIK